MEVEIERIQMEYGSQLDALGDELERLESDISGENLAIDSMREILSAYNAQQTDAMERIREFSESVDKSIHERTERVLARIDEVKAQQMETLAQELQALSRAKRVDDERRDEVQRQILSANVETARATREQVEVSRAGFRQVTSAVEQTTAAVERTTAAVEQTTAAVQENTAVSFMGFKEIASQQSRTNGILSAVAKEQGVDVNAAGYLQPLRRLGQQVTRVLGWATGFSHADIETEVSKQ